MESPPSSKKLASRLMASVGAEVRLDVVGVGTVSGTLDRVATGWCLVSRAGQDWVVALAAVCAVHGAAERSVPEVAWSPVARLGLGSVLRRLADTGERCVLHLADGTSHDAVPRRIGADFVEAAVGDGRAVLGRRDGQRGAAVAPPAWTLTHQRTRHSCSPSPTA